jgi:hypothetical protein
LDDLLDRELVCRSLLVAAIKFFDTMLNNSPRGCGTPFWELIFSELPVYTSYPAMRSVLGISVSSAIGIEWCG